ncbi:glycosyltransferase [Lachnospiraceae bacterium OttesenSCG-928-D06]|nr:glycosyltransferase [Lachnospiraceae bacterium OttesenSCG-928-D06]
MIPISFCIIARNEERHIEKCLMRLQTKFEEYPHEIVIIDTGSTDRTKEIARKYTKKIYDYVWSDDFSEARNESIRRATYDWVFIIDCDEYLEKIDMNEFAHQITSFDNNVIGTFSLRNASIEEGKKIFSIEKCSRLFSRKHFEYKGRIHEQLVSLLDKEAKKFVDIPLMFYHNGYAENPKEKGQRNIKLLKMELADGGADPYIFYQLGKAYHMVEQPEKALVYYERALGYDLDPKVNYVQNLVEAYGYCLIEIGYQKEAINLVRVYNEFAVRADFYFLMGHIYMNNGFFGKAVKEFEKATKSHIYRVEGVNGHKAYYNIGVIYECIGNKEKAIKFYSKCGQYEKALKRLNQIK